MYDYPDIIKLLLKNKNFDPAFDNMYILKNHLMCPIFQSSDKMIELLSKDKRVGEYVIKNKKDNNDAMLLISNNNSLIQYPTSKWQKIIQTFLRIHRLIGIKGWILVAIETLSKIGFGVLLTILYFKYLKQN